MACHRATNSMFLGDSLKGRDQQKSTVCSLSNKTPICARVHLTRGALAISLAGSHRLCPLAAELLASFQILSGELRNFLTVTQVGGVLLLRLLRVISLLASGSRLLGIVAHLTIVRASLSSLKRRLRCSLFFALRALAQESLLFLVKHLGDLADELH